MRYHSNCTWNSLWAGGMNCGSFISTAHRGCPQHTGAHPAKAMACAPLPACQGTAAPEIQFPSSLKAAHLLLTGCSLTAALSRGVCASLITHWDGFTATNCLVPAPAEPISAWAPPAFPWKQSAAPTAPRPGQLPGVPREGKEPNAPVPPSAHPTFCTST